MTVTYTVGDTREVIKGIADGSVDLIATSPPFLALRSYVPADHVSKGDEIGSERNPAEFIDMLLELTAEWGRVLAPHGSIAIELGDTYSGSGGAGGDYNDGGLREPAPAFSGSAAAARSAQSGHSPFQPSPNSGYDAPQLRHLTTDGKDKPLPRTGHDRVAGGATGRRGHGAPGGHAWPRAKSLALIPQLYAIALAYGINPLTGQASPAGRWLVRNVIVWARPNPAPGALGDKVRPSTSYIVVATRSAKRWFDLTAVRTRPQTDLPPAVGNNTKGSDDGSFRFADRLNANPAGAPPLDAWFDPYDGTAETTAADAAFHDTWTLTTQPSRLCHYAMWPAKLAERLVLMMCPSQVCRVCGEPRRRIEGAAEYLRTDSDTVPARLAQINGHRIADGINQHHNGDGANTSVIRNAPTLGWTDCGCVCPKCGGVGHYLVKSMYDQTEEYCSDCTDGRAFRPGLVLDPFCGSGTTMCAAELHGRDAIGIDFDSRNRDLYPKRMEEVRRALFGTMPELPGQIGMFDEVPA